MAISTVIMIKTVFLNLLFVLLKNILSPPLTYYSIVQMIDNPRLMTIGKPEANIIYASGSIMSFFNYGR